MRFSGNLIEDPPLIRVVRNYAMLPRPVLPARGRRGSALNKRKLKAGFCRLLVLLVLVVLLVLLVLPVLLILLVLLVLTATTTTTTTPAHTIQDPRKADNCLGRSLRTKPSPTLGSHDFDSAVLGFRV